MEFSKNYFEDEIRDGFYVSSLMKHSWAAQLEIVSEVDRVCNEHGLKWFGEYGTMIGAVREGGFIPWDDDIDLSMLREDYNVFRKLVEAGELKNIKLISINTEKNHRTKGIISALSVNTDTVPLRDGEIYEKFHGFPLLGIIDVFPIDYLHPDSDEEQKIHSMGKALRSVANALSDKTGEWTEEGESIRKDAEQLLKETKKITGHKFIYDDTLKQQVLNEADRLYGSTAKHKKMAKYVTIREFQKPNKAVHRKACYEKTIRVPFENTMMQIPENYGEILSNVYSDYHKKMRFASGEHKYPYYDDQIRQIEAGGGSVLRYRYNEKDLDLTERDTRSTPIQKIRKLFYFLNILLEEEIKSLEISNEEMAYDILAECQDMAVAIGDQMELFGTGLIELIPKLEHFCESLYEVYQQVPSLSEENANGEIQKLKGELEDIKASIPADIMNKKEIVFIPYKPENWKAMEPLWREAIKHDDWTVHVVPIPYYYRNFSGDLKEMVYDLDKYPEEVHAIQYDKFGFEERHPDLIITQQPYDEFNYTYSVHPFFFNRALREYTEKLVYIPWFVTDDFSKEDKLSWQSMEYFCLMPGVVCSDRTIVQSDNMKNNYVDRLTEYAGEDTRDIWEEKIIGFGSPLEKTDPTEWQGILEELV